MASKYAHLKGKVPGAQREQTPREQEITQHIERRKEQTLSQLAQAYNLMCVQKERIAGIAAKHKIKMDAFERMIEQRLDSADEDSVSMHGYTWSTAFLPFPVLKDANPEEIKTYLRDNGQGDLLELSITELSERLTKLIKEEAENNELDISERTIVDETTGEARTVQDVKSSKIPGVRVFLKSSLSHVKSRKGAK